MRTLNDCYRHAETRKDYWTAGNGSSMGELFQIRAPGYSSLPLHIYIYITNLELAFADGAGTKTKTVPTDDGGHIRAIYGDFVEIFSEAKANTLPQHRSTDHAI